MCMKVQCGSCGKPSWAGCGMHIESALRNVAVQDRCPGWQTGRCAAKIESAYVPPADGKDEKK